MQQQLQQLGSNNPTLMPPPVGPLPALTLATRHKLLRVVSRAALAQQAHIHQLLREILRGRKGRGRRRCSCLCPPGIMF